jgi:hypothetical protein
MFLCCAVLLCHNRGHQHNQWHSLVSTRITAGLGCTATCGLLLLHIDAWCMLHSRSMECIWESTASCDDMHCTPCTSCCVWSRQQQQAVTAQHRPAMCVRQVPHSPLPPKLKYTNIRCHSLIFRWPPGLRCPLNPSGTASGFSTQQWPGPT